LEPGEFYRGWGEASLRPRHKRTEKVLPQKNTKNTKNGMREVTGASCVREGKRIMGSPFII